MSEPSRPEPGRSGADGPAVDSNPSDRGSGDRGPADRFGRLLLVLLAGFLAAGLPDNLGTRLLVSGLFLVAVGVLVRATGTPRWMPARVVAVVLAGLVAVTVAVSWSDATWARSTAAICTGILVLIMLVAVGWRIVSEHDVQLQTLAGALCAYLLFGLLFSSVFAASDLLGPGGFFSQKMTTPDYGYFSFTTMLTIGYGDITILNDFGRRLAMTEALIGQVFLATVVARLITSVPPRRSRPASDSPSA